MAGTRSRLGGAGIEISMTNGRWSDSGRVFIFFSPQSGMKLVLVRHGLSALLTGDVDVQKLGAALRLDVAAY
jgi:hypothetical protein